MDAIANPMEFSINKRFRIKNFLELDVKFKVYEKESKRWKMKIDMEVGW